MRPSFLQAAVAAAVTSVAVAKERKEREEGEVAASRVQSSPFLFFYLANLFVLPTLRSRSLSPPSLPRKYYLDITVVFCASRIRFVSRIVPSRAPPSSPTRVESWSIQLHFKLRSSKTQRDFIALSRTRESNFHLLVTF